MVDYYLQSADVDTLTLYALNVDAKLESAIGDEGSADGWLPPWTPPSLTFYGWDERLGAGFSNGTFSLEAQRAFSMDTARACAAFAAALRSLPAAGGLRQKYAALADKHAAYRNRIANNTRRGPPGNEGAAPWFAKFGMHASAAAANAGLFATAAERAAVFSASFNESAQICSLSPFNMAFVLQGLGRLGFPGHALAAVRQCWGGMHA